MDVINEEEAQFLKTLSRGRLMFEREVLKAKDGVLPGIQFYGVHDIIEIKFHLAIAATSSY